MGESPKPLLARLKIQNKGRCNTSNPLCSEALEAHSKRRWIGKKQRVGKRSVEIMMKRRALLDGSKRPRNAVEKKVRTLKKLVPNSESMALDELFRETADYILSLEIRVRVMQIMVKVLSDSD